MVPKILNSELEGEKRARKVQQNGLSLPSKELRAERMRGMASRGEQALQSGDRLQRKEEEEMEKCDFMCEGLGWPLPRWAPC